MIQTLTELITFDDFVAQYPNTGGRYEPHDGIIAEMPKPKGKHSTSILRTKFF
ncbi:MAG: hypothetical protein AB4057_13765 [Crocosphaera sp.]